MQRFTFNRPITLLFAAPLVLLIGMFGYGLNVEFRISLVLMLLLTTLVLGLLVYFAILRKLKIDANKAIWSTPAQRFEMDLAQVKHLGIVKFRSFRFIYFSKGEVDPFEDGETPIVTNEETFVVQFRPRAWETIRKFILAQHPDLKTNTLTRQ
jgi:hypothetical protein